MREGDQPKVGGRSAAKLRRLPSIGIGIGLLPQSPSSNIKRLPPEGGSPFFIPLVMSFPVSDYFTVMVIGAE